MKPSELREEVNQIQDASNEAHILTVDDISAKTGIGRGHILSILARNPDVKNNIFKNLKRNRKKMEGPKYCRKRSAKEVQEDSLRLLDIAKEKKVKSYEQLIREYNITRNVLNINLKDYQFKCKLDRIIADNKEKFEDENCNKKLMTLPYLKRKKDGWYIPIFETPENLVAIESDGYIYSSRKMLDYKVKLGDRIIIFKDKCSYALFGVYQLVSLTKFDNCKKEILERLFCFDTGIIPEEYWQLADNFYKYRI